MEQTSRPKVAHSLSATSELLADCAQEAARRRVVRRRVVMCSLLLLGALGGLLAPLLRPTKYRASSRLQMFLRAAPVNGQGRLNKQGMTDQRELMLGYTFQQRLVARLSPQDRNKLFGGVSIRRGKHARSEEAELTLRSLANLDIEVEPAIRMMNISFLSKDPQLALAVVTAAVAAAEDDGLRLRTERTARVSLVLRERLDALERDIQQAELQLESDQRKLGIAPGLAGGAHSALLTAGPSEASLSRAARKLARRTRKSYTRLGTQLGESEPVADPALTALAQALNHAHLVRLLAETRSNAFLNLSSTGQVEALESQARGADRQALDRLHTMLSQQGEQIAMLSQQLGANQPALRSAEAAEREISRQLALEDQHLLESARAEAALSKRREADIQQEYEQQKRISSAAAVAQVQNQLPELNLAVDEDLDAVQTAVLRSAQVDGALKAFGFYVIDPPFVPQARQPRRYKVSLGIGVLIGAGAGLIVAFLMYLRELEIWDPADAERESGLGVVAVLPQTRAAGSVNSEAGPPRPEVMAEPQGLYSSAVVELAAKVSAHGAGRRPCLVLVTSATTGEGRSTTAANLAVVLARTGARVLLVDADLQRPTLHGRFGLGSESGLTDVLAGRKSLGESTQTVDGEPGLEVLVAGRQAARAVPLMQSGAMDALLESVRHYAAGYGYLVLDAPPALASSDSAYLAALCDILLLVARHGQVSLRSLQSGARLLRPSAPPATGLVVNAIPTGQ